MSQAQIMENIKLKGDKRTPTIEFDQSRGLLKIAGRSIPENSWNFYKPYIEWVKEYASKTDNHRTEIQVKLEYCNSSSGKYILDILQILDDLALQQHPVHFEWHYADNDEDMEERGKDLASFLRAVDIRLVEFKTESTIA